MYKCNDCVREFIEARTEKEVGGNDNQTVILTYEYCPFCDSSDINLVEVKTHEYKD